MHIAHIVPTKFLHIAGMKPNAYYLALSHIAEKSEAYVIWHAQQSRKGAYVILDNGVEENGVPSDIHSLILTAHSMEAKEMVLPDSLRNASETLLLVNDALRHQALLDCRKHGCRLAAVAQGSDRPSWIECFDDLNTNPDIDTIMIPKSTDEVWGYGGRLAAALFIQATGRVLKEKQYHLMGVWTDPIEVYLQSVYNPWIRSLDTALAFHAGYQSVAISDIAQGRISKPRRPERYFDIEWISPEQSAMIVSNIAALDLWGVAYGQHKSITRKVQ